MKRSEMIKVIKDYLDLANTKSDFSTEDMAEYILGGCCETFGMLPPDCTDPSVVTDFQNKMLDIYMSEFGDRLDLHKWEPEDE